MTPLCCQLSCDCELQQAFIGQGIQCSGFEFILFESGIRALYSLEQPISETG